MNVFDAELFRPLELKRLVVCYTSEVLGLNLLVELRFEFESRLLKLFVPKPDFWQGASYG